ncbi:MAG: dockerin type I repeat-containing protein [Ruminococcus sp.]|nr:dockerin type I repeat-containing protein [Ruminococcus sp.]
MKLFRKAISLVLAATMLTGVVGITASAQTTSEEADSPYYNGVFYYRPGTGEYLPGTDSVDYYSFSDAFFKTSGKEYNPHLATLSMALAEASVSSTREAFDDDGYTKKNRDAIAFLEDNGFGDIEINEDYRIKPTKDTMGVGCAHKKITVGDKEYTLLVIMPRNAGYEAEWGNNFVLGADGDAYGFNRSADICLDFTKDYIEKHQLTGDIKVWSVGYSRGAAAVNLIGKKLIDEPATYLGDAVTLDSENLYVYTFGTPSTADVDNNPRDEKYAGIFNSFENTELASAMAPAAMGFERYGTDRMILKPERFDDMLDNLLITNDYIHDTYVASISSRHYVPKKLGLSNGSFGMIDDPNSYIPNDPVVYLEGLGTYLNQVVGGREEFARTYEQPFSDLFSYYESLTGDNSSAFVSGLTSHEDTLYLVAGLYAYFMKTKSNDNVVMSREIALAKAKELAAVTVGADGEENQTGIDAALIAKVAAQLTVYLLQDPETIKKDAATKLSAVLTDAMSASGATQEQIAAVTSEEASEALVHLISHLLLGNIWQSDSVRPLLINNEQMKNAATLIGNVANLFVDHANEIIMSWLRTEDSYFTDYASLTDAQLAGYRRVYINADNASLNGTILDSNNEIIGKIENGVLTSSTDPWVGFTSTDDGGFFRVPLDKDYTIQVSPSEDAAVSVTIGEYYPYDATTAVCLETDVNATASEKVFVTLPALEEGYAMPSDATYAVTVNKGYILGDADSDGDVTISDVSYIQKYIAELETPDFNEKAADVNGDGSITIDDATLIQQFIAEMPVDYPIGV